VEVRGAFVVPVAEMIAVLTHLPPWVQNRAIFGERIASAGGNSTTQTGNDRADGFNRFGLFPQQNVQMPRVTGDDVGAGKPWSRRASLGLFSMATSRSSRKPRSMSAWVTAPVPGRVRARNFPGRTAATRAIAAASLGELGVTAPVRCGWASHSRRNRLESVNAAMSFLAMTLKHLFDSNFQAIE